MDSIFAVGMDFPNACLTAASSALAKGGIKVNSSNPVIWAIFFMGFSVEKVKCSGVGVIGLKFVQKIAARAILIKQALNIDNHCGYHQ